MKNLQLFEHNDFGLISDHCKSPFKQGGPHPQSPKKEIVVKTILESDLYGLIMKSKLESAERV